MCHHQTSGGDAVATLSLELEKRGYICWRDNGQHMENRDIAGMQEGVRRSCCLLLFYSGQKESLGANGEAYPDTANGKYESPFTRWFCHLEMLTARQSGIPVVVVAEDEDRYGHRGIRALERPRLAEVSEDWNFERYSTETTENILEQNLANKEIVSIPFRRQDHELRRAVLPEIVHQARRKLHYAELAR